MEYQAPTVDVNSLAAYCDPLELMQAEAADDTIEEESKNMRQLELSVESE